MNEFVEFKDALLDLFSSLDNKRGYIPRISNVNIFYLHTLSGASYIVIFFNVTHIMSYLQNYS